MSDFIGDINPAPPGYLRESRQPIYSAALLLPFILIYEIGLILLRSRYINGADAILLTVGGRLLHGIGLEASLASILALIAYFVLWQFKAKTPLHVRPPVLAGMFVESLFYAVMLYMLLNYALPYLPGSRHAAALAPAGGKAPGPALENFVLYCGTGVYEELVFRVLLLGLLMLVFTKLFHLEHAYAAAWSVIAGAIIFSAFHHIGPGADRWQLGVFSQRVIAGLYFAMIYFNRSFGVAAAGHSLYDILVGLDAWRH